MKTLKILAAGALLAGGATLALAQAPTTPNTTEKSSPSKSEPGAVDQGPAPQVPQKGQQSGSRPIGPPTTAVPAPGNNPTGESKEKRKSDQNDPQTGGKKQ
jgi:hypothetical protein